MQLFREELSSSTPTIRQFIKEHDLKNEDFEEHIFQIRWNSEWLSVTFFTEVFRYSVKFKTEEEFDSFVESVRNSTEANKTYYPSIVHHGKDNSVEVQILENTVADRIAYRFKESEWGIEVVQVKPKAQKAKNPATSKRSSSIPAITTGKAE